MDPSLLPAEDGVEPEREFEVEDILRYRRNDDGEEYFLVKWLGFSATEATWEPLAHMNDNCRELVAKARALFAWRRPSAASPAGGVSSSPVLSNEVSVSLSDPAAALLDAHPPDASPTHAGALGAMQLEQEGAHAPVPVLLEVGEEDSDDDRTIEGNTAGVEDPALLDSPMSPEPAADRLVNQLEGAMSWNEAAARARQNVEAEDVDNIIGDEEVEEEAGFQEDTTGADADNSVLGADGNITGGRGEFGAVSFDSLKRRGEPAAGETPNKRPKLPTPPPRRAAAGGGLPAPPQRTAGGASANGGVLRHALPTAPPTPPPTQPPKPPLRGAPAKPSGGREAALEDVPPAKPPSKEMKCICGVAEKLHGSTKDLIVCQVCNCSLHRNCVEGAVNRGIPDPYVCPPCRVERVDEFHPPVGQGLLRHSYAASSSTLSLSFTAQAVQWRKQQWAVHLRAVSLTGSDLGGPAWPHRVQGKLNGRQCVAIDPPKHLHVRREQCYNLTPLLRPGANTLELRFTPKPDRARDEPDEGYCVGVVLTRPRSVASILQRIKTRSQETVSSGRRRVERLLAQVARKERVQGEECQVTGNFGRTLKPLCPVSHCPIEDASIGRNCNHVQVFDLQAYIGVNQRMRSLDKRWTCPVCAASLRPDDVLLDPFAQGILDTLRGEEENVEAVVFNENCQWSTVSAEKEEKKDGDEEAIDLSDSE